MALDSETFEPADPGDVRFVLTMAEPDCLEETPYILQMIDDAGVCIETHFFTSAWERSNMIESFRYAQAVPFEVEFAPFGPAWQREQAERGR